MTTQSHCRARRILSITLAIACLPLLYARAAEDAAAEKPAACTKKDDQAVPAQVVVPAQTIVPTRVVEKVDVEALMRKMEEERKAELKRLQEDPAWQPAFEEVAVIKVRDAEEKAPAPLTNFCLAKDGNVLAAYGGEIRVFSPAGERLATWPLEFKPQTLCVLEDGTIFVAGGGRIAKLSATGKLLTEAESPALIKKEEEKSAEEAQAAEEKKEEKKPSALIGSDAQAAAAVVTVVASVLDATEKKPEEKAADSAALIEAEAQAKEKKAKQEAQAKAMAKARKEMMARRLRDVTGIAASDKDLFLVTAMQEGYGSCVWRMDLDFKNPTVIIKNLRGCCGQMDVQVHNGEVWIPENARHRVSRYDREGKELKSFGKLDRKAAEGFGGCCEPKNLRFTSSGDVLTSESGPPVVVKRFSPEGEFRGVVALPEYKTGCVRVTVEMNRAGDRLFLLNTGDKSIHVFALKKVEKPASEEKSQ